MLAAVLVAAPSAVAQTAAPRAPSLGRLAPVDAVQVIDHSVSNRTSDPDGRRTAACAFSADFLASVATPRLNHRIGVVPFGSTAPAELAVGLVEADDAAAVAMVRDACQATPDLGCTDIAAALRRASDLLGSPQAGRRRVVTVFTDGRPDTCRGVPPEALFEDIGAALADLASADVHVVGLDADGSFSSETDRWQALGSLASVSRLDRVAPGDLEARFTTILRGALGLARGDERQLTADAPETRVVVRPYQEALVISAIGPAGETAIELVGPDGTAGGRLEGRAGVLRQELPAPGEWRLRLVGGAEATVAIDVVPMQARVVAPSATVAVGRDITVEATFLTSADQASPPLARYPRYIGATVVSPGGERADVTLDEVAPGRYRAGKGVPVDEEGEWTAELLVKGATESVIDAVSATVNASSTPYLALAKGSTVRSRQPLDVPLELRVAGRPVDAKTVLGEDPSAAAIYRILGPDGEEVESGRVSWLGASAFAVRNGQVLPDGRRLSMVVELGSRLLPGEPVADRLAIDLVAEPSTGQLWLDRVRLAASVAAALAGLAVAAYLGWLLAQAPVSGRFDVGGQQVWMTHTRRKRVRVPGPKPQTWWAWGQRASGTPVVLCRAGRLPWPFGAKAAHRLSPAPTTAPGRAPRSGVRS